MKKSGWAHFVHPDDLEENRRLWQRSLDTGQPFQSEHRFRRADGVYRWHLSYAHAMRDEDGKVMMWISSNTDIEDQKQAQKALSRLVVLEQAARAAAETANHAKDEFLATVSHELRTPLTVILGWSSMMSQKSLDEAATARALQIIERSVKAQAQLVEDILDVSRIASGKLQLEVNPVRLASAVSVAIDSGRLAADAKSIEIFVHLDPDVGLVAGDPNRLQQVISNLLTNAVKFTPVGGRIEVQLERVNSNAQITVRDNGQGINSEFLPFIFDSFRQADSSSTRKYSGLGLGLSIVRNLVEMHGGTVHAQSPGEGEGAVFTVSIPLLLSRSLEKAVTKDGERQFAQEAGFQCTPEVAGLHILVVDDESDTREMLCAILEQCGAEVRSSSSATAALEMVEQWHPNLLLSDIAMPNEDGCWLIAQVRALEQMQGKSGKRLPAVALTAYVEVKNRVQVLEAGFDTFVPKPVNPMELMSVISSLVPSARLSN